MKLVSALCPNCGRSLDLNPNDRAALCPYCNTPFVVEDAVRSYRNRQADSPHASSQKNSRDNALLLAAQANLKMGDYQIAGRKFLEFLKVHPGQWAGWWGLIVVEMMHCAQSDISYSDLKSIKMYTEAYWGEVLQLCKSLDPEYKARYDAFHDYLAREKYAVDEFQKKKDENLKAVEEEVAKGRAAVKEKCSAERMRVMEAIRQAEKEEAKSCIHKSGFRPSVTAAAALILSALIFYAAYLQGGIPDFSTGFLVTIAVLFETCLFLLSLAAVSIVGYMIGAAADKPRARHRLELENRKSSIEREYNSTLEALDRRLEEARKVSSDSLYGRIRRFGENSTK